MSLFNIAKPIKSSSPWGRLGGAFLRLAVVGAPASGKTYLLSDLVMALGAMGYRQEKLPLTAQYSSLGLFFYDASNGNTGGMQQTEIYACRRENHYGGVFTADGKSGRKGRVEVDFLNIPGEVFSDNNKRMEMFFELKECIMRIDKSKLVMTRYVNPAGREQMIIEPNAETRALLHLDPDPLATEEETPAFRRQNYLSWGALLAELRGGCFERKESKAVTGKYIMEHFFEINPDSVIQSLTDIWSTLPLKLDYYDYEANNILQFAYFMLYCSQATDIILCDKLFAPGAEDSGVQQSGGYDFESLTKQLCNFMEHDDSRRPKIHLAFRGADIIIKEHAERYSGLITKDMSYGQRRKVVYDALMKEVHSLMATHEGGDKDDGGAATLTGMPLQQHIITRTGTSLGYGFWHLLNKTEPTGLMARMMRAVRGTKSIRELYSSPERPAIPPHVFFTATPIDIDMNIYDNDKDDVTVFCREDDRQVRSFHIETACNGTESMCLGSYQLLEEILR